MNVYVQSQDGKTYHWEVHHPRAPADQFCLPPTVEDNQVYSPVDPNHFELAYAINCRTLFYFSCSGGSHVTGARIYAGVCTRACVICAAPPCRRFLQNFRIPSSETDALRKRG